MFALRSKYLETYIMIGIFSFLTKYNIYLVKNHFTSECYISEWKINNKKKNQKSKIKHN